MALGATIFKVSLQIADMDRGYYETHALTVARHPSETSERMMIRVLAFALRAHEHLEFGSGVSTLEEPDLWRKSLTGEIEEWIDVGLPDPRRIHKACGRADAVYVYCYGGMKADTWWEQKGPELARHDNLSVFSLAPAKSAELAQLAEATGRGLELQCNIQDGEAWMLRDTDSVLIVPRTLMSGVRS